MPEAGALPPEAIWTLGSLAAVLLLLWLRLRRVRHRSEARLRESEARHRALFEHSGEAIMILEGDTFIDCNARATVLFGAPREALIGAGPLDFSPPTQPWGESSETAAGTFFTAAHQGEPQTFEWRHSRPDGSLFDAEITLCRVDVADRSLVQAVLRDVTEKKRTEEALRQSEERLQLAIRASRLGLFDLDVASGIAVVNEQYARLLGRGEESFAETEESWAARMHPEDRERVQRSYRDYLEGRRPTYEEEFRLWTADGWRWFRSVGEIVERDEDGSPRRMLGTTADVTEAKQGQEEEDRLFAAIEQTRDSVVITEPDGTIVYVNPAFEEVSGYSREEALGRNPSMLKSGEHDEAFYRDLWETISSGEVWTGRMVNRRKDGSLFQEEASISPVRAGSGEIVNFVAVKRDITREVELESQLLQAQKMEAVGHLAGGVAHDFNNILTAVIGFAELARRKGGDGTREHLEKILQAARRGAALNQRLLAFGRQQIHRPEVQDLNRIVEGMLALLRRLIPANIEVRQELASGLPPVCVDGGQLEQVLTNLMLNARDAISGRGTVVVSTRALEPEEAGGELMPSPIRSRGGVELAVADSGRGMDEATQEHIFEPFFTTKEEGQGSGMGLASVYGIVQQHRGRVGVSSRPGKGSTFRVFLPAAESEVAHRPTAAPTELNSEGREVVLVVEDNDPVLDLMRLILESAGYAVLTATHGAEGLQVATESREPIDLVITDEVMPGLSGSELRQRLLEVRPNLAVLITSGYSREAAVLSDREIDFLPKPFQPSELLQKVRELLDRP